MPKRKAADVMVYCQYSRVQPWRSVHSTATSLVYSVNASYLQLSFADKVAKSHFSSLLNMARCLLACVETLILLVNTTYTATSDSWVSLAQVNSSGSFTRREKAKSLSSKIRKKRRGSPGDGQKKKDEMLPLPPANGSERRTDVLTCDDRMIIDARVFIDVLNT